MDKFLIIAAIMVAVLGGSCSTSPQPQLEALFEAPEFSLQHCTGETLSKKDLLGHIWLVDFIFTRCGGPCPLMTQRMKSLQEVFLEQELLAPPSSVRLVSISVDPAYDSPEVLREYASNWGADLDSWYFLTGPEKSTLRLIGEGFKIAAERENPETEEIPDIIHSTNFLLVDRKGWVRKIFHLEDPNFEDQVVAGINALGVEKD
jgi:protein SCO1/2